MHEKNRVNIEINFTWSPFIYRSVQMIENMLTVLGDYTCLQKCEEGRRGGGTFGDYPWLPNLSQ